MNKGKVVLEKFLRGSDGKPSLYEYSVEHNNGSTSIEQTMTLTASSGLLKTSWLASVALDDFPPQETPQKAAEKLADWLERLASAIRCGHFIDIQESQFIDIKDNQSKTK